MPLYYDDDQTMLAETAQAFMAEEGAKVVLTDIAEEACRAVAEPLGSSAHVMTLDVTIEEQWIAAIAGAAERFGGCRYADTQLP